MAITGAHMLMYSPEAGAVRTLLRDELGWEHVDAGDGWLIFRMPPAELGIHPGESGGHELTLICDNLTDTVRDLEAKGVAFKEAPHDEGWGMVTTMVLPGNLEILLYEPRHPTAI